MSDKPFWNGGGWGKEQTFVARYTSDLWDRNPELDLTGPDFILEKVIRGRGVGSWVMQQLICWARTLPAETPVKSIQISPRDEQEPENMTRRTACGTELVFVSGKGATVSAIACE